MMIRTDSHAAPQSSGFMWQLCKPDVQEMAADWRQKVQDNLQLEKVLQFKNNTKILINTQ